MLGAAEFRAITARDKQKALGEGRQKQLVDFANLSG
jgi:hypothetical protein